MIIQRLAEADRPRLLDFYLRLSPESRKLRFCAVTKDETIRAYVQRLNLSTSHVVVLNSPTTMEIVGVVEVMPHDGVGEVGITLAEHYRGRGIGKQLFELAINIARQQNLAKLVVHTAHDNVPMLALAQSFGMQLLRLGAEITATLKFSSPQPALPEMYGACSKKVESALT